MLFNESNFTLFVAAEAAECAEARHSADNGIVLPSTSTVQSLLDQVRFKLIFIFSSNRTTS